MQSSEIIQKELMAGEVVLWNGQPSARKIFVKSDLFLIPFSIFWFAFAIYWIIGASQAGAIFALFGIPFIFVGAYISVGRFFVKKYNKSHLHYIITNKRVISITTNKNDEIKKMIATNLHNIQTEMISYGKNNTGYIIFGQIPYYSMFYMNTGMDLFVNSSQYNITAFFDLENIKDACEVYKKAKSQINI